MDSHPASDNQPPSQADMLPSNSARMVVLLPKLSVPQIIGETSNTYSTGNPQLTAGGNNVSVESYGTSALLGNLDMIISESKGTKVAEPVSSGLAELLSALSTSTEHSKEGKELSEQFHPPANVENLLVLDLEHFIPNADQVDSTTRQKDTALKETQQMVTACIISLLPLCELMIKRGDADAELGEVSKSVLQSLKLAFYANATLVDMRKEALKTCMNQTPCHSITKPDGDDDDTVPFPENKHGIVIQPEIMLDIACDTEDGGDDDYVDDDSDTIPLMEDTVSVVKDEELESIAEDPLDKSKEKKKLKKQPKKHSSEKKKHGSDKKKRASDNKKPRQNNLAKHAAEPQTSDQTEDQESSRPQPTQDPETELMKDDPVRQCRGRVARLRQTMRTTKFTKVNTVSRRIKDSSEKLPNKCSQCDKTFSTKAALRRHLRLSHLAARNYSCPHCDKAYKSNDTLKTHMILHTGEKPHQCTVCKKCFAMKGSLKVHMRTHTNEKPFHCSQCDKAFRQQSTLMYHMLTHSGARPYQCTICAKEFTRSGTLKTHMASHTGELPYQCTDCSKRYPCTGSLRRHIRQQHLLEADAFPKFERCPVCDKVVTKLKRHMTIHSNERPFICAQCGKAYKTNSCLVTHMMTHTGERPHKCSVCGKCFLMSGGLKVHMLTHTGEKPHQCSICGKTFTQKSILEYHISSHKGERPHECKECGKKYSRSHGLKLHMRSHTGERPHQCEVCGKKFASVVVLKRHTMVHTGERPHECPECGKKFQTSGHMKRHLASHKKDMYDLPSQSREGVVDNKNIALLPLGLVQNDTNMGYVW